MRKYVVVAVIYIYCLSAALLFAFFPDLLTAWGRVLGNYEFITNDQGLWILLFLFPLIIIPFLLSYASGKTYEIVVKQLSKKTKVKISLVFLGLLYAFTFIAIFKSPANKTRLIAFIFQVLMLTSLFVSYVQENEKKGNKK